MFPCLKYSSESETAGISSSNSKTPQQNNNFSVISSDSSGQTDKTWTVDSKNSMPENEEDDLYFPTSENKGNNIYLIIIFY